MLPLALALAAHGSAGSTEAGPTPGYRFPALTGRVVDEAAVLPAPIERRIDARSAQLERSYGHQLVVVTIKTLNRHRIEDYGVELARYWRIGRRRYDDGVVLLVAPNDRRVRIEVGYGLENILRDKEAAEIIAKDILPAFRAGDLPRGIEAGVNGIIEQISVRTDI